MYSSRPGLSRTIIGTSAFSVAMAYIEAAVVVYLRALYYPDGFSFPLRIIPRNMLLIEIGREAATVVMLASIALMLARQRWERFGWFVFMFGVWDVWYYIWLKIAINWPATFLESDILFLIPVPWIGPVIAPLLIALSMSVIGLLIVREVRIRGYYRPGATAWTFGVMGTLILLYSFLHDLNAGLHEGIPEPYSYGSLALGLTSYWFGFIFSMIKAGQSNHR